MSDNINIQSQSTDPPAEPLTREEQYLSAIAGVTSSEDIPEKPLTREEKYLNKIVENGGGGGGGGFTPTDEQLAAMNSGITAEDVEQIDTNKNNISNIQTKLNNIYIQPDEPTENISDGAIWINTATPTPLSDYIKKYHICLNKFNIVDYTTLTLSRNGSADNLVKTTANFSFDSSADSSYSGYYATSWESWIDDFDNTKTYTVSAIVNTDTACNCRFISNDNVVALTVGENTVSYTGTIIGLSVYIVATAAHITVSQIMIAEGATVKPYEPYNTDIWHSNNS